jgi:hypothetical protein
MNPTRSSIPLMLFKQIDALVCGEGFTSQETADRTRAYQAALHSDEPLCLTIAAALLGVPNARVSLFTGFVVPGKYPAGENDGPLGTAALARALKRVGLKPAIHVDPEILETMRWLLAELGADVCVTPIDRAAPVSLDLIDVAIAIEKPGANTEGVLHTFDGSRIEGGSKPIDRLFADLDRAGTLTIGIGDRGNEIGFGLLHDALGELTPRTQTCACGCGGGVAATTTTRHLYPAAVSNWGAYGIAAALALLGEDPTIALRPEEEQRMLLVAAVRGCCDGVRRRGVFGVDGLAGDVSVRLVGALHDVVAKFPAKSRRTAPVRDPIESENEALRE